MNTRIQVEHPVSEMITGIDLVKEMIRIAAGEPLSIVQDDVRAARPRHRMPHQCREPRRRASCRRPVLVTSLAVPEGPHVRFDTMLYAGYVVPPFYDSLLGKLIVWGENRDAALERLAGGAARPRGGRHRHHHRFTHRAGQRSRRGGAKVHTRWLEAWLETNTRFPNCRTAGADGDEDQILVRRRRARLRRSRRGDVAGGVLQEPVDDQRGARQPHQGRHRDLPGERIASGQVRSRRDRARRHAWRRSSRSRPPPASPIR